MRSGVSGLGAYWASGSRLQAGPQPRERAGSGDLGCGANLGCCGPGLTYKSAKDSFRWTTGSTSPSQASPLGSQTTRGEPSTAHLPTGA